MAETNGQNWIELNQQATAKVPRADRVLLVCVGLGVVGLALAARHGVRAWQAYWVNFLFWMGLAQAGVVLAALVRLAKGEWGGGLIRLGLLQVAFLPVSVVLFVGIAAMSPWVLPWVAVPLPEKHWWLNLPSFLLRNGAGVLAMCIVSAAFAYHAIRPEAGALAEAGHAPLLSWLTRGWRGTEAERQRSERHLSWLAPLLVILYGAVYSLLGFDLIMSLDPRWYSALFGGYYFITTGYLGIAGLAFLAVIMRRAMRFEDELTPGRFHDLGKLVFAFGLLSAYFFWSQWLVLWYGDIPEEIRFVLRRIRYQPWLNLVWVTIFGGFVIPWTILLSAKIKRIPVAMAVLTGMILVSGFCERMLMIIPSLHDPAEKYYYFGIPEILIIVGFAGLYGLSLLWLMRRAPLIPPTRISAKD